MLGLASSSSTVSAIRAIATSRTLSASIVNSFTSPHHKSITPYFISHNFSTDVTKSTDHKLTVPAAPAEFPFTFVKKDIKENVFLTRDFNGENIEVMLFMPKIQRDYLSAADGNSSSESGDCFPEPLHFSVRIKKENRKKVYIGVTMCPHLMQANMMQFGEPADDRFICFGIHDVEGEELQCAVEEYLKIRGIRPCYAEFLYRYMVWKSKGGPLEMMEKMKKFIKD